MRVAYIAQIYVCRYRCVCIYKLTHRVFLCVFYSFGRIGSAAPSSAVSTDGTPLHFSKTQTAAANTNRLANVLVAPLFKNDFRDQLKILNYRVRF